MVPLEESFIVKLAPRQGGHGSSASVVNSSSSSLTSVSASYPSKVQNCASLCIKASRFRTRFVFAGAFFILLATALLAYPAARIHSHRFVVRPHQALSSFSVLRFLESRQFNGTLLALAKVDLGEPEERRQITSILDGSWQSLAVGVQVRDHFLTERLEHEDHYRDRFLERRRPARVREQREQNLPLLLKSPRYAPFWPQFRSSLQRWVENKRYDPTIMKQLISMVKDPVDQHYSTRNTSVQRGKSYRVEFGKPYRTCAIVGNSGILVNQSNANIIDSHDMVMRLNNARIAGFQEIVGTKTTLSFVNSNILQACARRTGCFCHPYGTDVPMIMYMCQVVHFMDVALCGASQQAPIIVTDPRFDTLCAQIIKYYSLKSFIESGRRLEEWSNAHEGPLFHYSSGMQAVLLAVGICDQVSIFGFGKSDNAKHHYHTSQRAELKLHDYAAEYQFYMDLATRNPKLIPFLSEAGVSIPSVHIFW